MKTPAHTFVIRRLDDVDHWVIDVIDANGEPRQLVGVYVSQKHALDWIENRSHRFTGADD